MTKQQWIAVCVLCAAAPACQRGRDDARRSNPDMPVQGADGSGPRAAIPASVKEVAVPKAEDPMKEADRDMQDVLTELQALGPKPIETLSAADARKQPTPSDAVKALLTKQGKSADPEAVSKVQERAIPGRAGPIPIRVYTPAGSGPFPVVVYYHGGGFVIATNDTYDASARALTNAAQAVVVSVEYRKAPEHKFPAAHEDALAAYRWVTSHTAALGGDVNRIAVAGESAGGNLAANVAIQARDQQLRQPVHVLLIYPVASSNLSSESYEKYRDAKPLDKAMMAWFTEQYFNSPADAHDPRISLIDAKLVGLPPTTIINAEIDPLAWDGEQLAKRLEAAEVPVKQKTYAGVTHEFFGMGAVVADARVAEEFAGERLKSGFDAAAERAKTAQTEPKRRAAE